MRRLLLIVLLLQAISLHAQKTASVLGKVIDSKTQEPLSGATASLQSNGREVITNTDGFFVLDKVPDGEHFLTVTITGYIAQNFSLKVIDGRTLDLGIVVLEEDIKSEQQLGLIALSDNDLADGSSGSDTSAGLLQASRDVFQQSAAFNWGGARFKMRGLDTEYGSILINGISMNRVYDGRPQWANWSGLNDATQNQEYTTGTAPSDYTFGSLLGTQAITTRASVFKKGARISFAGTNTYYGYRAMATYASGVNRNGFSYVVSASRRGANEGYFDGTNFGGNSFFMAIEKRFNDKHSLNFTGIYAQSERGRNSPNTQEVTNIAGVKYNSYWGNYDGNKRNSRQKDVEEPILMLNHYWKIDPKSTLNTNVAYQFGKIGNSRIDYQYAPNPDPTYYTKMPGYFDDPAEAANAPFVTQRQLNWQTMYDTNALSPDGRSKYIEYEDRTNDKTLTVNSILFTRLSSAITLNAGASFKHLKSHNYQNLTNLLGGNYFLDINQFYYDDFSQPDLNHPDRQVSVGDTFGYNYNLFANTLDAFTQFRFSYKKVDFYLSQSFSRSVYQREGLYRTGLYPSNSFGKSEKTAFENFGFKGGLTYKLTGRHLFVMNALRQSRAPSLRNTFANARLNNSVMDNIGNETLSNLDASYILRMPKLKARLTGFYTTIENASETSSFYGEGVFEGDDADAFVAENLTGINKRMMGLEMGIEYQFTPTVKFMASAALGNYIYSNNPNVSLNNDALAVISGNDNGSPIADVPLTSVDFGKAYLKNYKLAGMPQQAVSVGFEYRDPHYWWIGANANYLASNYIDVSALLRTEHFFENPDSPGNVFEDIDPNRAKQLLHQEKFDSFYLFNIVGGKSWKVGYKKYLGFFASINNLFDATYKTGGFEQSRNTNYRELDNDMDGSPSFGPKYYYGYGRNYYLNIYLNF
ncbi:MAG: TonB-dependent receptor [Flavobacterium psychrophilum]|nr:MAG: TonB-dependent receptor [Flavobacterium psychrophilum]